MHCLTRQRPVTDALRRRAVEDLPEREQIGNADLRRKAVETRAFARRRHEFVTAPQQYWEPPPPWVPPGLVNRGVAA